MRVDIPFHNLTLTVEAEGELETLKAAQRWLDVPKVCPVCGLPTELRYRAITAKTGEREGEDFEYVDVQCTGYPKRHRSTLGQYKPKNGGGFYYRENLDKFPWDEYDLETKASRPVQHEESEAPSSAKVETAPTRADLLQVYAALQDKDRAHGSAFLSFLAAYPEPRYSPEAARKVAQRLEVLDGPGLLEPDNLRRILEKVGTWQDGTFTLDPDALHGWEARFAELGRSAA